MYLFKNSKPAEFHFSLSGMNVICFLERDEGDMAREIFVILLLIFLSVIPMKALGELEYNYMEKEWEETAPRSSLQYNPLQKEWQYAPSGSDLQYNPMGKKYEYAPDSYELKHNYMEKRWEYAPPDSTLKYNPYEKEWEFDEEGEW